MDHWHEQAGLGVDGDSDICLAGNDNGGVAIVPARIQERVVTKRDCAQLDDKIREARHRDAVGLDGLELATKTDEIRRVDRR